MNFKIILFIALVFVTSATISVILAIVNPVNLVLIVLLLFSVFGLLYSSLEEVENPNEEDYFEWEVENDV